MLAARVCWHTLTTDWLPAPLRTGHSAQSLQFIPTQLESIFLSWFLWIRKFFSAQVFSSRWRQKLFLKSSLNCSGFWNKPIRKFKLRGFVVYNRRKKEGKLSFRHQNEATHKKTAVRCWFVRGQLVQLGVGGFFWQVLSLVKKLGGNHTHVDVSCLNLPA